MEPTSGPASGPSKDEQDRALKALKKRLKLARQDNESSFAARAMTGGKVSSIVGVALPSGFAPEVWQALVTAGRIKRTPGSSTYELVVQKPQ